MIDSACRPGFARVLALLALLAPLGAVRSGAVSSASGSPAPLAVSCLGCPPVGLQYSMFSGTRSQALRLSRTGVPSNCPDNKPFPGTVGGLYFWYETFEYENLGNAACVRVVWNPNAGALPCGPDAHAKLYAPAYDPLDQAAGFLGDAGLAGRYNFRAVVPADSPFVLVVENTDSAIFCTFAFEIVDVPCQAEADEFVGDFDGPTWGQQDGRLLRDGVASTCGNKSYPGETGTGTVFNHETVAGSNDATSATCFEVEFNPEQCPNPCVNDAFASVHSPAYDAEDLRVGYLGDAGLSAQRSFYVTVPPQSPFEVAITNTLGAFNCNYSIRIKPSIFADGFDHGDALSWSVPAP